MRRFPKLSSPAILSPMAGVTDVAFRALCKRYGAGMTYTEFVSSAALVRNNEKTKELLVTDPSERPVGVQLFGANEEEIIEAAKLVAPLFDVIDMNCGCPAFKVIKTGAGSALLNDPAKIGRIVEKVVAAVDKPVTVKIRAGIDSQHINAVAVAKAAEAAGAAAITVHGRTQQQGYSGEADWAIIKAVKEAVSIPVIGNGNVFSAADFMEKWRFSGCDYVMVARGAIGNPGIFAEIHNLTKNLSNNKKTIKKNNKNNSIKLTNSLNNNKKNNKNNSIKLTNSLNNNKKNNKNNSIKLTNSLNNNKKNNKNNSVSRIDMFLAYNELAQHYKIPFGQVKGHALRFTKGFPGSARLRERLSQATSNAELLAGLETLRDIVRF